MGKRARKPKKMGDGSEALVTSLQPVQKCKKTTTKKAKKGCTKKMNSVFVASCLLGTNGSMSNGITQHTEDEEEEDVDVDVIATDEPLHNGLASPTATVTTATLSQQFLVKETTGDVSPSDFQPNVIDIKPDVFDPAYEMHTSSLGYEYVDMGPLVAGGDATKLSPIKHEDLVEDALVPSSPTGQDLIQCSFSSLEQLVNQQQQQQEQQQQSLSSSGPAVVNGDLPDNNSLVIPTSLVNAVQGTTSTTTAFAQVTKIEQAADSKGYVLHLNIPALGLSNVVLSTPGLSLAPGMDQKVLESGPNGTLPSLLNISSSSSPPSGDCSCSGSQPSGVMIGLESLSDEGLGSQSGSDSPNSHEFDSVGGLESGPTVLWDDDEGEDGDSSLLEAERLGRIDGSSSSSSSDSGCGIGMDPESASSLSGAGSGPETEAQGSPSAVTSPSSPLQSAPSSLSNVAQWVEKPEIERFVICSDGPMECVLCSFKTLDYSAFKSHIICSHPCWRITKKLSKNRLLVEKSVKMNVSLAPATQASVSVASSSSLVSSGNNKSRRLSQGNNSSGGSKGDKDSDSVAQGEDASATGGSNTATTARSKKGLQVYQRKKQMLERNKRLFRCSVCMRLFVFEGSIVNHLVDIHLVKSPYDHIQVSNNHGMTFGKIRRCSHDNCFASCVTDEELERHRLESHAQVIYRCQICGFTAETSDAIETHASLMHSQYDLTD